jgi:hypothetical protein
MSACPEVLNWEISTGPGVGAVVPKSVSVAAVWARPDTAKAMTIAVINSVFVTGKGNFALMILQNKIKDELKNTSYHASSNFIF